MKGKAEISVLIHPKKEIVVNCSICRKELARVAYEGYADYHRKRKQAERQAECPNCGAAFVDEQKPVITWGRTIAGDWIARVKDGDFLVWKDGGRFKWRFRKYGGDTAEIHFARTKADAMIACSRHERWKL